MQIRTGFISLTLILTSFFVNARDSTFISLRPGEFQMEITRVNDPVIVDVREFFEYKRSRLKDAINIPSSGNTDHYKDSLDKKSHIFLYCTSGVRSKKVAKSLIIEGFTRVFSLDGGISAWKKEGLPLDKRKIRKRKS